MTLGIEVQAAPARARLVLVAVGVALVLLTCWVLWSRHVTEQAGSRAAAATAVTNAYRAARLAVVAEESAERKYRAEPSAQARADFDAAGARAELALTRLRSLDERSHRPAVTEILAAHSHYVVAADDLLRAIDAGDRSAADAIDHARVDPAFERLEAELGKAAERYERQAATAFTALRHENRVVLVVTPVAFVLGLALLGIFVVMLVRINRALERVAAENRHAALHDSLTGLANRTLFGKRLEQAVRAAERSGGDLAVLMLDLDRFKEVNDTLGHHAGDEVLREAAARLRDSVRPDDTVARLGGDEFAVLLPGATYDHAEDVARRVAVLLSQPVALPDAVMVDVTTSTGIVAYPLHGTDASTLMQRADIAMYIAKSRSQPNAGYESEHDPFASGRLILASDLRQSVCANEIQLEYQPKVALSCGTPVGVEALARWRHPARGPVSPSEFVPLAERTGLIKPLTLQLLREAARLSRGWDGEPGYDLHVAVNLSCANLLDAALADDIARILDEEEVEPERMVFEVTETVMISNIERARACLGGLTRLGSRISIDDYGTGHSSLAYLQRLPVSELKIDRAFVQNLAQNPTDRQIVRSTIELCHSLGLTVVAEGVEDGRSLELLGEWGCDLAQGYHLCPPVTASGLAAYLAAPRLGVMLEAPPTGW